MIQRPRGTKDIYGIDSKIYEYIFDTFKQLASSFNLEKITTPTFEAYDLFDKTSGETSDIISKEIYSFKDFSNRHLALKPEGTAPIARAIVENKLFLEKKYNKLYYIDSMYRYDKPQKGRLRQFYQIGVEFTNELNEHTIIETIVLANTFLKKLKIENFTLHINSLGTNEERQKYIQELTKYFKKNEDKLSSKSKTRIESNPLRILDDKEDSKLEVVKNAPKINEFWSKETIDEFQSIQKALNFLKINYVIDYSLVRGLDYYSNIVYEFVSNSEFLGSQATLIGGGCYQDLVKFSPNPINGVGFGCGVERLFEIIKAKESIKFHEGIDVFFLIEREEQYFALYELIYKLREQGVRVEYNFTIKKFKKLFNDAKQVSSKIMVFQELNQQNSLEEWTIKIDDQKNVVNLKEILMTILKLLN